jgi:hypothetical protein
VIWNVLEGLFVAFNTLRFDIRRNKMDASPMDVDPVDDGPRHMPKQLPMTTTAIAPAEHLSEGEEARQAIDMLRGDDVSARVAAASRLESVASVLGQERTREVCIICSESLHLLIRKLIYVFFCFSGTITISYGGSR